VHPRIVKKMDAPSALIISQLLYWTGKGRDGDGWTTKCSKELYQETGVTTRSQRRIRKRLGDAGLVEFVYHNSSHSFRYKINMDLLRLSLGANEGRGATTWVVPSDHLGSRNIIDRDTTPESDTFKDGTPCPF